MPTPETENMIATAAALAIPEELTEAQKRQAHFDKLAYELGDLQRWREFQGRKAEVGVPTLLPLGKGKDQRLVPARQLPNGLVLVNGQARNTAKVKMRKKDRMRQRHENARMSFAKMFSQPIPK